MVVDGARAEQQTGGDLPVGGSLGGHAGHHQLLGGQPGGQVVRAVGGYGRFAEAAENTQLGAGLGRTLRGAEVLEGLQGAVQAVTRLRPAAQRAAEQQRPWAR